MKKILLTIPAILLGIQVSAVAQVEPVPAGTEITVRTNDGINSREADGRIYTGTLERDILDRDGRMAIPRARRLK